MSVQNLVNTSIVIYLQSLSGHLLGTSVPLPETQLSPNLCKTNTEKCQMKTPKKSFLFQAKKFYKNSSNFLCLIYTVRIFLA